MIFLFTILEHSGVLIQCQEGKTPAVVLENQVLLHTNLKKTIKLFTMESTEDTCQSLDGPNPASVMLREN